MKDIIPMLSVVLLLSGIWAALTASDTRAADTEETIVRFDMEDPDDGITHGGSFDSWEWGPPGPGTPANPGPGRAGEGERCFGSPLNGTYYNGTRSYLLLPDIDISSYMDIRMDLLIWYDLTLRSDERNESGEGEDADWFHIDVKNEVGDWNAFVNVTGSSGGSWVSRSVDLSTINADTLSVRFMLEDVPDGRVDNGVFIDMIVISGSVRPGVDIHFREPPSVPGFLPVREASRLVFTVVNHGQTIPPNTFVSLEIEGPSGWGPYSDSREVTDDDVRTDFFEWTPWLEGPYIVHLNLTVDSVVDESYRYTVFAVEAVFFESFSYDIGEWRISTEEGNGSFELADPGGVQPTSTSGGYLSYRQGASSEEGFSGVTLSMAETPQIDLTSMEDAHMYIFHSFGFLGDEGSCGGVVQGRLPDGSWKTLDPDLPHTRLLTSGPMSGQKAFQGDREWYQIGFDLGEVAGSLTSVRFILSSGPSGEGRGWLLDDIMVTGEGYSPFDREPPEPVTGLTYEVLENGRIRLSWSPSFASDLKLYRIYMGRGEPDGISGEDLLMEWEADNGTSVTIGDLDPGTGYWFAVTAVDRSGNEDLSVSPIHVVPRVSSGNRAPVARIRVIGSSSGRLGDLFVFNGSGSYDPDGDIIELIWELPDGSRETGCEVKWRSTVSGAELPVRLTVLDGRGLEGHDNITISVSESPGDDVGFENITTFLVCMVPVLLIILVLVLVLTGFRAKRQRKLRRELMRSMEKPHDRPILDAEIVDEEPDVDSSSASKEVMDLIPLHTGKKHGIGGGRRPAPPASPVESERKKKATPLGEVGRRHRTRGPRSKEKDERVKMVSAVIECPFCQKTFKMKLEKQKIDSGKPLEMACPHCGRSGMT